MRFSRITPFKVFLKTKEDLLKLGYEDNNDKEDFINLMAGHVVTIEFESENNNVYICKEFPEYAIYDYFIKGIAFNATSDDEYTLTEIASKYDVTAQAISGTLNRALKKMKNIILENNLDLGAPAISF
jgi:hypothetical protein